MREVRQLGRGAALGAAAVVMVAALTGCGESPGGDTAKPATDSQAGGADSRAGGADSRAGGAGQPPAEQEAGPGAADGKPADKGKPADPRVDQRAIVYTGTIVVRVEDIDEAAAQAVSYATAAGGFVGGDKRTSDDSRSQASLRLRVPADRFSSVVDQIAKLGDQERRDINAEDVTKEVLDLDARIATQRARVDSGRRLLAQAKTLDELILLEGELAKREADLASLEARKRHLDDVTALSTITAVLLGRDAQTERQTGFLAGLDGGWKAFLASVEILLTVLGALLPWLIALGVPGYGLVWLIRRIGRRSRRPRPFPPLAPTPAGFPGQVPAARSPQVAQTSAPPAGPGPQPTAAKSDTAD